MYATKTVWQWWALASRIHIVARQTKAKAAALSRLRKYELRYQKVLDAAAAVFAEKGYLGTTTQNIATKIGIRQSSLYYYASSKEELLEAVCEVGLQGFVEEAERISQSEQNAPQKIRAIILAHLEPLKRQPNYVQVFLNCRKHLPKASRRAIGKLARGYEDLIEGILREGVEAGEFCKDLDCRLTTLAILGIGNSVPLWLKKQKSLDVELVAEQVANILLTGIEVRRSPGTRRRKR